MKELPVHKVYISIEKAGNWIRYFAGRPTKEEVLAALAFDKRAVEAKHGDETGRRMAALPYENYATLVRDHGLPEDGHETKLCVYAGVTVGRIAITEDKPVIVPEGGQ